MRLPLADRSILGLVGALAFTLPGGAQDQPPATPRFQRLVLSEAFHCEAAAFADVDDDGLQDVVAGPYWYAGPDFRQRHEIYEPLAFDPLEYSDNFAVVGAHLNGDAHLDLAVVGFPGAEAGWYENPGKTGERWKHHVVLPSVGNESATFVDLVGDARPELVGNFQRRLGYAHWSPGQAHVRWTFVPISPRGEWQAYTHGLGIGDLDGDGRKDVLERNGWWRQPASPEGTWEFNRVDFGTGGAQMWVADLTGDGHPEVITSLLAHGYGLAWFEQTRTGDRLEFRKHLITSEDPEERLRDVQFSQLHAVALGDIDGDGQIDIVTGKRWWAHGPQSDPEPNADPVVYAFLQRRDPAGSIHFEPLLVDAASGVGTQIDVRDVNGDDRADIVTSNKRGTFLFLSQR